MSEIYNEEYYKNYDVGCGKVSYENSEYTKGFLIKLADRIVADFHPKTVLDAGCALGFLVAALRDRGVEAYGIDISEYAISKVREDIRPFCKVGSLTEKLPEGLPETFDLVVSIEVLEHLYAADGNKAIQNICGVTDTVLFSSSPDDFEEPTHVNVQQREYWGRLFFQNGFTDDITYRPQYLTSHAVLYRKNTDMARQIEDYERNIRMSEHDRQKTETILNQAISDKERHIQNLEAMRKAEIENFEQEKTNLLHAEEILKAEMARAEQEYAFNLANQKETCEKVNTELAYYKMHYAAAIGQREELKRQLADCQNAYNVISNAFLWKITKPLRLILDFLKNHLRKITVLRLLYKGIRSLFKEGFSKTWKKAQYKIANKRAQNTAANMPLFSKEELEAQRREIFPKQIKFSIVVPLFNTPEKFLREMIESVLNQTYSNFELCMADGSDKDHKYVGLICRQYMKKDKRIRYNKLEKNLGISENTNACLKMAAGDYIGLFDHDDLLHPAALHEVMRAICEENADFIYTDENTFHNSPNDAFCPHFKPDFAPDTLRANNYICHFTVFKKSLLEKTGVFRSECDGSQDFDMVLRLTEQAKKIVHIPKILYYWRAHKNSVADSVGAKPYVISAAHRALEDHLKRVGLKGEVLDTVVPSMYRIRYEIQGEPLISIIIPNMDHAKTLKNCVESILNKSSYKNYEILIVENNSVEKETFAYYKEIEKLKNIEVVSWQGIFNYSAINNFGAGRAKGEYLLLLNNDTEIISPDWLQEMLMFAQRSDVGAVGAKLYYPDDTIQHAGIGIGLLTLAGHMHRGFDRQNPGYMGRLIYAQDLSAVTAACVMIPRRVWNEIGGLDESFEVAFNDVDMCMRIRKAGYLIVWTPFAELYHYESKSRGAEDTPEKQERFSGEVQRFQQRWRKELNQGDPYYNPNFSLDREDFSIRTDR